MKVKAKEHLDRFAHLEPIRHVRNELVERDEVMHLKPCKACKKRIGYYFNPRSSFRCLIWDGVPRTNSLECGTISSSPVGLMI